MIEPGPQVESLIEDGIPRWDAIEFDVLCSRCDYNLRTLSKPRCPECGLEFEWAEALDRAEFRSDFLFEHHWRSRPIWSFFTTVRRAMRPAQFWQRVSIHDRIEPGPLWCMMLSGILAFLVVVHGTAWLIAGALEWLTDPATTPAVPRLRSVAMLILVMKGTAYLPVTSMKDYWPLPASLVGLQITILMVLCGLRQTLGRCRVRTAQVLRVVAYTSVPTFLLWAGIYLSVAVLTIFLDVSSSPIMEAVVIAADICFFSAVPFVYTSAGLKHYLLLPRPSTLAFAAVIVAFLLISTVYALVAVSTQGGWN